MTRLLTIAGALALALAGYAAAFAGNEEPCIDVTYTDHVVSANKMVEGAGVIAVTVTPIPPGCE